MDNNNAQEKKNAIEKVASALEWIVIWLFFLCLGTCNPSTVTVKIDQSKDPVKVEIVKGESKNVTGTAKSGGWFKLNK